MNEKKPLKISEYESVKKNRFAKEYVTFDLVVSVKVSGHIVLRVDKGGVVEQTIPLN